MKCRVRCGECGERVTERKNQKGKTVPYKSHNGVKIVTDLFLFECDCGNVVMKMGEGKIVDEACEISLNQGK